MSLHLQGVSLPLSGFVLKIDAALESSITGIFGPSGSGKTSLLDLIAGLRRPSQGRILLNGEPLWDSGAGIHVPPRLRRIGYVPQDLALFPHLDVRRNLIYGHQPKADDEVLFTLEHVAEVMEITTLLARDVVTLSGGEKQRVAFARAVLSSPRLLLLDEPMSSLDARLKTRLVPYLQRIRDDFRIPLIYVTHDARELGALCEEILFLEQGLVVQRGTPADLPDRSLEPPVNLGTPGMP